MTKKTNEIDLLDKLGADGIDALSDVVDAVLRKHTSAGAAMEDYAAEGDELLAWLSEEYQKLARIVDERLTFVERMTVREVINKILEECYR